MTETLDALTGHTSEETAYVVNDYPYGFVLRCKIRYWLEYNPKHGYRLCSQTTNPRRPSEVWNKPKKSTYAPLGVMGLDSKGHVQWTGLSMYSLTGDEVDGFGARYAARFDAQQAKTYAAILRVRENYKKLHPELYPVAAAEAQCDACGEPIGEDEQVVGCPNGAEIHPECFDAGADGAPAAESREQESAGETAEQQGFTIGGFYQS